MGFLSCDSYFFSTLYVASMACHQWHLRDYVSQYCILMKRRVEDVFQIHSPSVSCDYSFKAYGGKCYSLFLYSWVDRFEAFPSICKEAVVSHTGKLDALIQIWDCAGIFPAVLITCYSFAIIDSNISLICHMEFHLRGCSMLEFLSVLMLSSDL